MAEKVEKEVGIVSMIIHCCGMPSPHSLVAQPPPDIQATMDRSVMSHFWVLITIDFHFCCMSQKCRCLFNILFIYQVLQAFLPQIQEQQRGHIVALSSVAGLTGIKDQVPLSVSQFAVKVSFDYHDVAVITETNIYQ